MAAELLASARNLPLGASGITVSGLAWGMWRLAETDPATVRGLIEAALETGITLFDTADIYGMGSPQGFGSAEARLGDVLRLDPALRARMVIGSKAGIWPGVPYDSSETYLNRALDDSLQRLGIEQLDLWQVHRPDVLTHPEELARTLENAVRGGKVRAVGVSNFTVSQIEALSSYLAIPLVSTQPEFSALRLAPLENGEFDQAMRLQLRPLAWSPLGGGRIAQPANEREAAVAAALDEVAAGFGVSRTAAALSWIMAHPAGVIPIVGSQQKERIREAAGAFDVRWTRQTWYEVLVAARGERLP